MAASRTWIVRGCIGLLVVSTVPVALLARTSDPEPPAFLKGCNILWRRTVLTEDPGPTAPPTSSWAQVVVAKWTTGVVDTTIPAGTDLTPPGSITERTVAYRYPGDSEALAAELRKFKPGKEKWWPLIDGFTFWAGRYIVLPDHREVLVESGPFPKETNIEVVVVYSNETTLTDRIEALVRGGYQHPSKGVP